MKTSGRTKTFEKVDIRDSSARLARLLQLIYLSVDSIWRNFSHSFVGAIARSRYDVYT